MNGHPWNRAPRIEPSLYRLTVTKPDATATAPALKLLLELSAQLERLGHRFVKLERVESAP